MTFKKKTSQICNYEYKAQNTIMFYQFCHNSQSFKFNLKNGHLSQFAIFQIQSEKWSQAAKKKSYSSKKNNKQI